MVSWASLDPVAGVAGSVLGGVIAFAVLLVVFAIAVAGWPDIGRGDDDDD